MKDRTEEVNDSINAASARFMAVCAERDQLRADLAAAQRRLGVWKKRWEEESHGWREAREQLAKAIEAMRPYRNYDAQHGSGKLASLVDLASGGPTGEAAKSTCVAHGLKECEPCVKSGTWDFPEPAALEPAPASAVETLLRSQKPMDADVRAAVYENPSALYIDAAAPPSAQALLRDYVAPEAGLAHWEWLARRAALLIRTPAPASAQGTTVTFEQAVANLRREQSEQWVSRAEFDALIERVKGLATRKVCRHCQETLLPENRWMADGCPCNSGRGINHGLVATDVCTCELCDPAKTGGSRFGRPAARPQPAPVERTAENAPRCCDTDCRHYGQRHWTPHEVREEPAPVERHVFEPSSRFNWCRRLVDGKPCGQPRSAAVHGEGEK